MKSRRPETLQPATLPRVGFLLRSWSVLSARVGSSGRSWTLISQRNTSAPNFNQHTHQHTHTHTNTHTHTPTLTPTPTLTHSWVQENSSGSDGANTIGAHSAEERERIVQGGLGPMADWPVQFGPIHFCCVVLLCRGCGGVVLATAQANRAPPQTTKPARHVSATSLSRLVPWLGPTEKQTVASLATTDPGLRRPTRPGVLCGCGPSTQGALLPSTCFPQRHPVNPISSASGGTDGAHEGGIHCQFCATGEGQAIHHHFQSPGIHHAWLDQVQVSDHHVRCDSSTNFPTNPRHITLQSPPRPAKTPTLMGWDLRESVSGMWTMPTQL